jgi:hypothetical protein
MTLSPAVSSGLVSMLIGGGLVVWGLTRDRLSIIGAIIFVLGLVAVVRGLLGHPED